jgi:phosphatidate cytidylyltransferase
MKTRILTAAVCIPVLLLILLVLDKIVATVLVGALLAVSAYELLYATGLVKEPRLVIYSCICAFSLAIWSYFDAVHAFFVLLVLIYLGILFGEMMHSHVKITFDKIAMCVVAGLIFPFLMSSLVRILMLKIGRYVVTIPFIIAFGSDAGAYFAGRFFGKHKMAPVISQHKTVEGAIGGVVAAVVLMVIYALIMSFFQDFRVNYLYAVIYGVLCSLAGIFGDLCFSVIKRQTGIKDYGKILPGHGGVLDRFDSMVVVAPLVEVLLLLIPVIN